MDKKPEKLVPEVRFKGFTDDWEQRKLSSIAHQTFGGGTPSKSNKQFWNGDFPWIQSSDLAEDTIRGVHPNKFITQNALLISAAKKIPKNSIAIVSRVGVGKVALIPFNYSTSQDFLSLSGLKINSQFATYSIHKIMKKTASQLQGTSIKGITKKDILNKTIIFPISEKEQVHISSLLKYVDYIISLQQRKLNQLKRLKTAMLQQLFTDKNSKQPNLRFKNFRGDWEQRKLKSVVSVNSGKDYKSLEKGNIPVYGTGGYIASVSKFLSSQDAIGLGRKGTINKPYILKAPFWTVDTLFYLTLKPENILTFIYSLIQKINWLQYDESTGLPSLSKKNIENVLVSLTKLDEQQKIGKVIVKLDKFITLQQSKIDQLTILKKYLLQKLFI